MFRILVDEYRKQTTHDYFRLRKLLELQAEWDQEDVNEAYDRIIELEKELRSRENTICRLERETHKNGGHK